MPDDIEMKPPSLQAYGDNPIDHQHSSINDIENN